jgi:hypothetical protein
MGRHLPSRRRVFVAFGILVMGIAIAVGGGSSRAAARPRSSASAPNADSPGPLLPTVDPFYRWSGSLAQVAPGTVLRTRSVTVTKADASTQVKATQLLYVTTNELGQRVVSVTTVLRPLHSSASSVTRLVSYQEPYDARGAECDPSYTLQLLALHETSAIPAPLQYAASGYTVVTSDYEGEDLAYGAGQQSGYETLDAVRAAEKWLGIQERATPVALVGYSGGAITTEFASELAHTYSPDLDVVGVAEGGIPVDPFHNVSYVDHPGSDWNWVIPALFEGVARGFGLHDLDQYLTPRGIAVVSADRSQCAGAFTRLTTEQLLKP